MSDAPDQPDDLIGRIVDGRFRIERRLGAGGMGAVYLAEQLNLRRPVAVKVLRPGILDEAFRTRFRAEAMATSRLNHPNIVTVHDFGLDATGPVPLPFLVLERLDGQDLRGILSARGRLTVDEGMAVLSGIAAGLGVAHAAGIIHRDLKPENVFLVGRHDGIVAGNVKILDFGIARIFDTAGLQTATASGVVVGTPGYVPPERLQGATGDARADLYALGVMAWEIFAGRPPFDAPSAMALAVKHMMEPVPSLNDVPGVEVPAGIVALVSSLLSKSPEQRPADAAAVLAALRTILVSRSSPQEAPPLLLHPRTSTAVHGALPTPAPLHPTQGLPFVSRGQPKASPLTRRWRLAFASVVGAGAVAAASTVLVAREQLPSSAMSVQVRRITFDQGVERDPVLAPDGAAVVFAAPGAGGLSDLFLLALDGSAPVNLTNTAHTIEAAPTYSGDGTQLAWSVHDDRGDAVWIGGPRGEAARRAVTGAVNPAFSPDGHALVVGTAGFDAPERVSTSAATATIKWLDLRTAKTRVVADAASSFEPSVSVRGRIAFWAVDTAGQRDIWTVGINGGAPVAVTNDTAVDYHPQWSADGATLHFLSDRSGTMGLWSIAIDDDGRPVGEPVPFFAGGISMRGASVAGGLVAYRSGTSTTIVEGRPLDAQALTVGSAKPIFETTRDLTSIDASPNGAWLVSESVAQRSDLLLISVDGHEQRPLTNDDALDRSPRFVDDNLVAFASNRSGSWGIWLVGIDGSGLRALPAGPCPSVAPLPSPSGTELVAFQLECGGRLAHHDSLLTPTSALQISLNPGAALLPMAWRGASVVVNRPGESYDVVDLVSGTVVNHAVALGAFVGLDTTHLLAFQERALVVVDGTTVAPLYESGADGQSQPFFVAAEVNDAAFTVSADRRTLFTSGRREQSDLWVAKVRP